MPDIDVMPTDLEVLVAPRVRLPNSPDAHSMLRRMISIASSAMLLASCHEGVLDPRGPAGKAERVILYNSTAIMLAVVIPVIVLTLVFVWWFRAKNKRAQYRPDWEYSGRIEMIIWSIPALVISVSRWHRLDRLARS